jgi:hypothetical protein
MVSGQRAHHGPRGMTYVKLLCACLVGVFSLGCPAPAQYQPNTRLVSDLGVPQAQRRLKEALLRCINPQMVEADVTDDFLHYRYRQVIAGIPTGAILENRVFFVNVARVEVFINNVANVWAPGNHLLAQLIFGNPEDARTFADLVMSFHGLRTSR